MAGQKIHELHEGKLMTSSIEASMGKENRRYPRKTVTWPVIIKTTQRSVQGETRDVSSGGAFIYCDNPKKLNQIFYLTIHIHPKIISFTSMAEVVWLTSYGMGVRFHPNLPEEHQFLAKFISDS